MIKSITRLGMLGMLVISGCVMTFPNENAKLLAEDNTQCEIIMDKLHPTVRTNTVKNDIGRIDPMQKAVLYREYSEYGCIGPY